MYNKSNTIVDTLQSVCKISVCKIQFISRLYIEVSAMFIKLKFLTSKQYLILKVNDIFHKENIV